MAIFKRKHDPFIANVTRSACGSSYIIPSTVDARLRTQENDDSVPLVALSDKETEDLPEAAAAMMIYGYCTLKYQQPSKSNEELMKELLASRGFKSKQIDDLMVADDSLYSLVNFSLEYVQSPYTFSNETLTMFYKNLCKRSPIFKDLL